MSAEQQAEHVRQNTRYDGKRVLVTGGSSGMGDATVALLRALGAEVHVLDIKEPTQDVAGYCETDLRDPAAIDAALAAVGGPIHGLFGCAGLPPTFPLIDVLLCNFCGPRHLVGAALPLMPTGAAIAMIASVAGMRWPQFLPTLGELVDTPDFTSAKRWCEDHQEDIIAITNSYTFSKMALILYAKRTAVQLTDRKIRMNTLSPGSTATPMMPSFVEAAGAAAIDTVTSVAGRLSDPAEQAYPLVFLNSDGASYVNGCDLVADGGFSAALTTGLLPTPA